MGSVYRTTLDREVDQIRSDIVLMSQKVDWAIEQAIRAVSERNLELAQEVISKDVEVNDLRFKIEEACLVIIATQQPAARDLRSVVAVMHMVVELERMGDHAEGIAKTAVMMAHEPKLKTPKKILKMSQLSRQMLADCVQAFLKRDVAWARAVASQDTEMDHLYRTVFERLIELMAKHTNYIAVATYMSWCAHNLERIADRVTNIVEQIIFMNTGDMTELNK
ncbi:MAG: phosphate signaling complex protein PhoU [Anaerolineales bacterium]|jgi:phosphate transport system protein|nr:phosphate signaling complex protein PhoU [Anaerolineales bacterium]